MPGLSPTRCMRYQAAGDNPGDHPLCGPYPGWSLPWPCQASWTPPCNMVEPDSEALESSQTQDVDISSPYLVLMQVHLQWW